MLHVVLLLPTCKIFLKCPLTQHKKKSEGWRGVTGTTTVVTVKRTPCTVFSYNLMAKKGWRECHQVDIISYTGSNLVFEDVCVCNHSYWPAAGHWFRKHHPGRVHRLEQSLLMDPPGYLPYQHRGHSLWSQLFVDAEEIDFYHVFLPEIWKKWVLSII